MTILEYGTYRNLLIERQPSDEIRCAIAIIILHTVYHA